MAREEEKLKLGKGAAFEKGRLKRLRQEDETWEADFQALPKPITQSETHYLGMVVAPDGSFLADSHVEGRPTVNDMATLLAHAMRRPLTGKAHRPRRLHVRGHHQWRELFPHLEELGISVSVKQELPKINEAYRGYLRRHARRPPGRHGQADRRAAERREIVPGRRPMGPGLRAHRDRRPGDVRVRRQALDDGELVFEDDRPDTLAEAMASLEKGLRKWFDEQGIELDKGERP